MCREQGFGVVRAVDDVGLDGLPRYRCVPVAVAQEGLVDCLIDEAVNHGVAAQHVIII